MQPGRLTITRKAVFSGHTDCVYALELGPQGQFFSSGSDGLVVKWQITNPEKGEVVARCPSSCYALLYQPESGNLVIGNNFNGISVINLETGRQVASKAITGSYVFDIKQSGNLLLVACGDGSLHVLDAVSYERQATLAFSKESARKIAIHPFKSEFAVGYSDAAIRIFSLQDYGLLYTLPGHGNSVFSLTYTPDGIMLISGSRDAHLKVWDTGAAYSLFKDIVAHMYAINDICINPAATHFYTCSMDKTIKIWQQDSFKLLKVIDKARAAGHATSVNKLMLLPENGGLLSASDDRTISLWHIENISPQTGS